MTANAEVKRIIDAYARRLESIDSERYSAFELSNLLRIQELERVLLKLVGCHFQKDLRHKIILEIGCGSGYWLRQFIQWGARPENLFGVDLLEERIRTGRELCPSGVQLELADASNLDFRDNSFDLILQLTVFTSIVNHRMKEKVASEMNRVLKPGGAIVWYDYFMSNPSNPDVRGVTRKEIVQLFPELSISLKRITLAPPIARVVGPLSPALYRALSTLKPFCTHYLGFFKKK